VVIIICCSLVSHDLSTGSGHYLLQTTFVIITATMSSPSPSIGDYWMANLSLDFPNLPRPTKSHFSPKVHILVVDLATLGIAPDCHLRPAYGWSSRTVSSRFPRYPHSRELLLGPRADGIWWHSNWRPGSSPCADHHELHAAKTMAHQHRYHLTVISTTGKISKPRLADYSF